MPMMLLLDPDGVMEKYFLRRIMPEVEWPIFLVNIENFSSAVSTNPQTSMNYIFNINDVVDLGNYIKYIKMNNTYWDSNVKILITAFYVEYSKDFVEEVMMTIRNEDINGILLIKNSHDELDFNCYVFKALYCYFRACKWNRASTRRINFCSKGELTNNKNVTMYRNWRKAIFTAAVMDQFPYFSKVSGKFEGIEYKVMKILAEMLQFPLVYVFVNDTYGYGDSFSNGTNTGAFKLMAENKADIALGGYGLTYNRATNFYPAFPFLQNEIAWCVPHEPVENFSVPINQTVSLYVIFCFILISLVVYVYYKFLLLEGHKEISGNIFMIVFAIIISETTTLPRSCKLRSVLISALFLNLFFETLLFSFIASSIADIKYTEMYGTMQDIIDSKLKINAYFTERVYLEHSPLYNRVEDCTNSTYCLYTVAHERKSALAVSFINKEFILKDFKNENGSLLYCLDGFLKFPVTMYFRHGFPYYKRISAKLLLLTENGMINRFTEEMIPNTANIKDNVENMLKFRNLLPIFVALIVVYFFCILIFIFEIMSSYQKLK